MVTIEKGKSKKPYELFELVRSYVSAEFGPLEPNDRIELSFSALGHIVTVKRSMKLPKEATNGAPDFPAPPGAT